MKINKSVKEDYSRIIGQIDCLKSNIAQLISVRENQQDTTRTVRIADSSKVAKGKSKSPVPSRMKTSRTAEKLPPRKKGASNLKDKQNKKTEQDAEPILSQKLWEKLVQVERSNLEIKTSHLALEDMLRVEREKRIKLEKQLKAATKMKNEVGIQKDLEVNRSESFKIFTPERAQGKSVQPKRKPSKTRDEGDIESFLLGDCDEYLYSSPKRRNARELEMMELIHQLSRPGPFQKREEAKGRLLQAVRRLFRRG